MVRQAAGMGLLKDFDCNTVKHDKAVEGREKHRIIEPGLSYYGVCKNKACEAHDKTVVCNRGFGCHLVNDDIASGVVVCPCCRQPFTMQHVSLFECKATVTVPQSIRKRCHLRAERRRHCPARIAHNDHRTSESHHCRRKAQRWVRSLLKNLQQRRVGMTFWYVCGRQGGENYVNCEGPERWILGGLEGVMAGIHHSSLNIEKGIANAHYRLVMHQYLAPLNKFMSPGRRAPAFLRRRRNERCFFRQVVLPRFHAKCEEQAARGTGPLAEVYPEQVAQLRKKTRRSFCANQLSRSGALQGVLQDVRRQCQQQKINESTKSHFGFLPD